MGDGGVIASTAHQEATDSLFRNDGVIETSSADLQALIWLKGLIAFFGHRLVAGAVDDSGFVGLVFPRAMITLDLTICYASSTGRETTAYRLSPRRAPIQNKSDFSRHSHSA